MSLGSSHGVATIIVNWNGRRFLGQCLAALERQTTPVRVVVVDNGSTDGSLEYLEAREPQVELIALARTGVTPVARTRGCGPRAASTR